MSGEGIAEAAAATHPFSLLLKLFGDTEMTEVFSEDRQIRLWMDVEVALARAQAAEGILDEAAALDISHAAGAAFAHRDAIWKTASNVGYPILAVVRLLDAHTSGAGTGHVHLGATTQDIMDTALAIQLRDAADLLVSRLEVFGDALAELVEEQRDTVMAGRTHAQQAVPITLGMKLAVLLDQVRRAIVRIRSERDRAAPLSLFGAAGTSAAFGPKAPALRGRVAAELGLEHDEIPWHVARDGIFAQGSNAVAAAETATRFAREIIDLSRTEIGEVREAAGDHRGASSTMPQKANPILSEAIVGFGAAAVAQLSALGRGMEAGHERSAGEWQVEWHVLPQIFALASGAVLRAAELARGLVVDERSIRRNLFADHGLLMAEAYMIALSGAIGRERAHDLVYAACEQVKAEGRSLVEVLLERVEPEHRPLVSRIEPEDYVGEAAAICDEALARWAELVRRTSEDG